MNDNKSVELSDNMTIIQGNCLEKLQDIPDESVDAVVTDPPYELGFMGKKWDGSGIAYSVDVWKEVLRVLKPGGHLLSFGGTRTFHRMAVAIEDSGFEIRDMLEWIHRQGFPKSLNVGKKYDQLMKNEREVSGKGKAGKGFNKIKGFGENTTKGGEATTEWEVTKGNSRWEGFGSALKPAHEPIVLARRPLSEKTIVENCIKHGTGALDIDGCKIPTKEELGRNNNKNPYGNKRTWSVSKTPPQNNVGKASQGRFPANLLVTDDALNDGEMTKSKASSQSDDRKNMSNSMFIDGVHNPQNSHNDSGSKSRFFNIDVWAEKHGLIQCPKASKRERNAGCEGLPLGKPPGSGRSKPAKGRSSALGKPRPNNHPTVKPLHLMSWLIRLVSKDGDVVLDPFMGSGTTGVACKNLGREFIGIEKDPDYCKIAKHRLKKELRQMALPLMDNKEKSYKV